MFTRAAATGWWFPALACAGAYLLGSLPTGLWVARARGIDIRAVGSGNIGATNVARALGKRWAVFVLLCDALKGFLPVTAVAHGWGGSGGGASGAPLLVAAAGLCAIVGHMFTIFLRGRGGKGVATSLGVACGLCPPLALASLGVYAVTYAATRLSSLGSLLGMWAFPVLAWARGGLPGPYVALSVACALLVTWRHRENIRRLLGGSENKA